MMSVTTIDRRLQDTGMLSCTSHRALLGALLLQGKGAAQRLRGQGKNCIIKAGSLCAAGAQEEGPRRPPENTHTEYYGTCELVPRKHGRL